MKYDRKSSRMEDQKLRLLMHAQVANEIEKYDVVITNENCFRVTRCRIAKRFPNII